MNKWNSLLANRKIEKNQFDLVIIGGGITGAGIAMEAAGRGLSVCLFEMQDFAAGTSSRSTKLIHGGLRYLKQFEFGLVKEVGREREVIHNMAPHLVVPEKMLLPLYKGGTFGPLGTNIGLSIYDWLAGVKSDEQRKMLSPEQCLQQEPLLKYDGLIGGGLYYEYRTNDARLTLEVLKKAEEFGAVIRNYTKVEGFEFEGSKSVGVRVHDTLTNSNHSIHAKSIINAAGPWVDEVRRLDSKIDGKHIVTTKGVHIVVNHEKLPLNHAVYFDVEDGRMIFAIPEYDKTYIGTTDTFFDRDKINPHVTEQDVNYLLKAVNKTFNGVEINQVDVISSWAGLRPLLHESGKGPSELSRKDEIWVSESGLITMAGGKLTGFRLMAQKAVNKAISRIRLHESLETVPFNSASVQLNGSNSDLFPPLSELTNINRPTALLKGMAHFYGTQLLEFIKSETSAIDMTDLDWITSALNYSIDHEHCYHLADFVCRRVDLIHFFPEVLEKCTEELLDYYSNKMNLDDAGKDNERYLLNQHISLAKFDNDQLHEV